MRSVADRRENDATNTTKDNAKQREVLASPRTTDDAIRTATKLAIDAGDLTRARALLDVLETKPRNAPVLVIAPSKPSR